MYLKIIALLIISSLSYQAWAGGSMRCGSRLVQKNDLAIQVRERCGKPVSIDILGYTLRGSDYYYATNRKREFKIEQWIYGPERGYYSEVIFEAGRVKKINRIKQ